MSRPFKPTPAMLRALRNLVDGRSAGFGLAGRASAGGLSGTLAALERHGLTAPAGPGGLLEVTPAGRKALDPTAGAEADADDETCTDCWGTGWNGRMEQVCDCQGPTPEAVMSEVLAEEDTILRMRSALWSVIREWQSGQTLSTETERAVLIALASDEERPELERQYTAQPAQGDAEAMRRECARLCDMAAVDEEVRKEGLRPSDVGKMGVLALHIGAATMARSLATQIRGLAVRPPSVPAPETPDAS